jgi:hypothetical protein
MISGESREESRPGLPMADQQLKPGMVEKAARFIRHPDPGKFARMRTGFAGKSRVFPVLFRKKEERKLATGRIGTERSPLIAADLQKPVKNTRNLL